MKSGSDIYETSEGKANLFGKTLEKIFKEDLNPKYDNDHKEKIENFIRSNENDLFHTQTGDEKFDEPFSLTELEECLNSLNTSSSGGEDKLSIFITTTYQIKVK